MREGTVRLAKIQGLYFLAMGIWPLVHIDSFMTRTGPKIDLWLVKTVGLLVAATGCGLLLAAYRREITASIAWIAIIQALGLAAIDVYYSSLGLISNIYLADAALEAIFLAGWTFAYPLRDDWLELRDSEPDRERKHLRKSA